MFSTSLSLEGNSGRLTRSGRAAARAALYTHSYQCVQHFGVQAMAWLPGCRPYS